MRLKVSLFSHNLQEGAELILKADWDCLKVHRRTIALNKPVLIALHLFKSHIVVHFGEKLALLFSQDKSNNKKHSALISLFISPGPSVTAAFLCVYLPSSTLCCNQLRAAPRV